MLLRWYRALIALRRARSDLRDGDLTAVQASYDKATGVVVVERGRHRVAVNLSLDEATVDLRLASTRAQVVLLSTDRTVSLTEEGTVTLPGEGVAVVGPTTVD